MNTCPNGITALYQMLKLFDVQSLGEALILTAAQRLSNIRASATNKATGATRCGLARYCIHQAAGALNAKVLA